MRYASELKERWSQYKLMPDARPKMCYEYFVSGTGEFPFDMLRYDDCWPITSEDAYKIGLGFHESHDVGMRSIRLRSYKPPTVARWSSFTWSVGTEDLSHRK